MRRVWLLLLTLAFVSLAGCYEKKVCCPVDGGCPAEDAAEDVTDDATSLDTNLGG